MNMKPIKVFGKEENIKYYGTDSDVFIPEEYEEKDRELRGVWFSTVANIDIPKMKDTTEQSIEEMKKYLVSVINKVKEYKMNTVIFQVRPVNDALYESSMNPWSKVLTGAEGTYPGFDVFGYFIKKAKEEQISVHAWINPYRAGTVKLNEVNMTKEEFLQTLDEKNFARRHPECVILTKDNKILLDPANEVVREFVSDSIIEIASKYDIKAVHIDDYFYPYEDINDPDEDRKRYKANFARISDFRRNNVDLMIELIHNKLNKLEKKVEFGISPFGIYRTNKKYFTEEKEAAWEKGSNNHPGCLTNYAGLYADVFKWMEKGWIDYVCPQDYFDFDNTKLNDKNEIVCLVKYADLVSWWSWAADITKCKLYIGQALYRVGNENGWQNPEEIINQLKYNQTFANVSGTVFFTYKDFLRENSEPLVKARKLLKKTWKHNVKEI